MSSGIGGERVGRDELRSVQAPLKDRYRVDPATGEHLGNTPQAFSHVPLVQTALNLGGHATEHRRGGPMDERRSVPG